MSRIKYLCPSCQNETLVVDDAGFLVCSWAKCEDPGVIHLIIKHGLEPKPPASEGVRLSVDEAIFKIEDYVGGNIEGVDTIDRMSFTRFLRQNLESLAALPELERRLCWRLRIDGESKHTKDCYECNGHGEVWVRKAGV